MNGSGVFSMSLGTMAPGSIEANGKPLPWYLTLNASKWRSSAKDPSLGNAWYSAVSSHI